MYNKELAEKINKPVVRIFNEKKVHSSFIDNFWGADLANIALISKFNKEIRFLLYDIDIFNKYP